MIEGSGNSITTTNLEGPPATDISSRGPVSEPDDNGALEALADTRTRVWIAAGLFFMVLGVYVLSGPGRIDIIDGEARFDVALNWLVKGQPIVTDRWIGPIVGVPGVGGFYYSYYGPAASFLSIPLVWLGVIIHPHSLQPSQFLFSLTSAVFGAGIASVLFLFYLELGVAVRRAVAWTLASSFATYVWAISTSTFDNAQHGFFAIAALYLAFVSARRKSWVYALSGGLFAGVLFLYQEYFLLIFPALALATLDGSLVDSSARPRPAKTQESLIARMASIPREMLHAIGTQVREAIRGSEDARQSFLRYGVFFCGPLLCVVLMFVYNDIRFGSWFDDGKLRLAAGRGYHFFGSPLAGLLTLLVSPGKSIFLYSPPIVLAIAGARGLWRRRPGLMIAVSVSTVILVSFLSCIKFASGDWCWGPRYLTALLPLWALAFPFIPQFKARRSVLIAVIAAGVVVQVLGLSVENQRFFFERGLNDFFWAENPWFYLQHSAFFARFQEFASLTTGVPSSARAFNSIPQPDWTTYSLLGPPGNVPRALAPVWMQNFQIFYLPRPWPLWVSALDPTKRPVPLVPWIVGFLGIIVLGAGFIVRALPKGEKE